MSGPIDRSGRRVMAEGQNDAGSQECPLERVDRSGRNVRIQSRNSSLQMARFLDFGTGALGDMACHTLNMSFMGT